MQLFCANDPVREHGALHCALTPRPGVASRGTGGWPSRWLRKDGAVARQPSQSAAPNWIKVCPLCAPVSVIQSIGSSSWKPTVCLGSDRVRIAPPFPPLRSSRPLPKSCRSVSTVGEGRDQGGKLTGRFCRSSNERTLCASLPTRLAKEWSVRFAEAFRRSAENLRAIFGNLPIR
jgi:hypothetical protein